ncbi:hypothetical protein C8Q74DRAFT_1364019 [Fomes fomentarius]|nr:hypothetical protein C8Q74DRAFT_1364019 [Fomes fomentarius]
MLGITPVIPIRYADDPEKGPQMTAAFARPPFAPPPGYSSVNQYPVEVPQGRPRNLRRRRFWHLLTFTVLFIATLHVLHWHNKGNRLGSDVDWDDDNVARYDPSVCSDTVNWTKDTDPSHGYPYHAQTSLTLPLTATDLSFVASGSSQTGHFEIVQDLDEGSKDASIDVDVFYRPEDALDDTTVCRTHLTENASGLAIFTRQFRHSEEHRLFFQIRVHLPVARPDAIIKINSLWTDPPNYVHDLPDLADSVYFPQLKLGTSNGRIQVNSVAGDTIKVLAANAVICGTFNTSTELELVTSNAPITVRANLLNGDTGRPTSLLLKTANGQIEGSISLASNTSDATKGNYSVTARTSNAPLHLSFVNAPVEHWLTLEAHTANAPAEVTLHKTYEGKFDLASSPFFRPVVSWGDDVEDPKGQGRKRFMHVETDSRNHVRGLAVWGLEAKEPRGSVQVETSNSPLHLTL